MFPGRISSKKDSALTLEIYGYKATMWFQNLFDKLGTDLGYELFNSSKKCNDNKYLAKLYKLMLIAYRTSIKER